MDEKTERCTHRSTVVRSGTDFLCELPRWHEGFHAYGEVTWKPLPSEETERHIHALESQVAILTQQLADAQAKAASHCGETDLEVVDGSARLLVCILAPGHAGEHEGYCANRRYWLSSSSSAVTDTQALRDAEAALRRMFTKACNPSDPFKEDVWCGAHQQEYSYCVDTRRLRDRYAALSSSPSTVADTSGVEQ